MLRQMKSETAGIKRQAQDANKELVNQDQKLDRMNKQLDDIHSINKKNDHIATGILNI